MKGRRVRLSLAFASMATVVVAAGLSSRDRWNFDFAQYKGRPREAAQDEFRFVIVGDRTGGAQWGLMPQTFREINLLDPDFVVSVGDLIDGGGGSESTIHGIWDEFDTTEMPVLQVPFVYTPGNHDIWSPTSRKVYEQRYGPRFKSFNYRGLHFITLNTEEGSSTQSRDQGGRGYGRRGGPDALGEEQLKWLQEDIERNRHARRILLFMHQPIWRSGGLDKVYPLLEGLRVNIFAGHWHKYSYEEHHGIPHIICSATAAYMPDEGIEQYGRFRSYLMASVRDDDLTLALVRLGGVLSPKYIMDRDQEAIRRMADACAIRRSGDSATAPARVIFRNVMPMPVRLQIVKSTRSSTRHLFDGSEPTVAGGATLDREIDWAEFSRGSAHAEYRVVYRFNNSGGEYQTMEFPVDAPVERDAQASVVSTPRTIDGDLSEWSGAKWQAIGDRSQLSIGPDAWQGPHDTSAQFAVAADNNNVYVAVQVSDDVISRNSPAHEGDSIELFTANANERLISFSYESDRQTDFLRLIVAPFANSDSGEAGVTAGPTEMRRFRPRGIWGSEASTEEFTAGSAAYSRDSKNQKYSIELALPRSILAWDGEADTLKELDIAINDCDSGSRRESQLTWSGTDRNANSSRYFGRITVPTP